MIEACDRQYCMKLVSWIMQERVRHMVTPEDPGGGVLERHEAEVVEARRVS